jgi:hypothetical protein
MNFPTRDGKHPVLACAARYLSCPRGLRVTEITAALETELLGPLREQLD